MKLITFLLVYFWVPSYCAYASPSKPLLWQVSSADNSIYLLGSFHLLKTDDYPLDPAVEDIFDKVKKVYFEVPLDQMNHLSAAGKMF